MDEKPSPMLPDHTRRSIVLDELRAQAGRQAYVKDAILRWEQQIRLRAAAEIVAQPALCGGPPLPTEPRKLDLFLGRAPVTGMHSSGDMLLAAHGEALQRAQHLWSTTAFLSDVVALLRDEVKFPAPVAELLAPLMLCEYVEWADAGPAIRLTVDEPDAATLASHLVLVIDRTTGAPVGPVRGTPVGGSLPPCVYSVSCPLQPAGAARLSRYVPSGLEAMEAWHGSDLAPDSREHAEWYFEVEIMARQIFGDPLDLLIPVAERLHPTRAHSLSREFSETCGCTDEVSLGVREVKQLFGLEEDAG